MKVVLSASFPPPPFRSSPKTFSSPYFSGVPGNRRACLHSLGFQWSMTQGPEAMCLLLEHQNPSKTSRKMGYFYRVAVSLHILLTANQETEGSQDRLTVQNTENKGRKQIWGRFSNPWNSNGIEWNRLIVLTWPRILMYLPNTVGKWHKKAFKFIFCDRIRSLCTATNHRQTTLC